MTSVAAVLARKKVPCAMPQKGAAVDADIVLGANHAGVAGRNPYEGDSASARMGADRLPKLRRSIQIDDIDADPRHWMLRIDPDLVNVAFAPAS